MSFLIFNYYYFMLYIADYAGHGDIFTGLQGLQSKGYQKENKK